MPKISLSLFPKKPAKDRSCDGCTKCCEGWLTATIHGEPMYPGKPCQFVDEGTGCTIYEDRPKDPCKEFLCEWRVNEQIPLEFKPSLSNSIILAKKVRHIDYYNIADAGSEPSSKFLSWLVIYCMATNKNVRWEVGGKAFWFGSPEFVQEMQNQEDFIAKNSAVQSKR